ncbi:MAG: phenylalanine--tRNA ligase subunit alpha [Candidatus Omnitrophica bacterium]|nr:phenylalanine--tRNA ligase subunit alpha [Candidatus Omnitrophota bacterium]
MENEIRDIRHSFEEEMKNVTDAKTTEEMRIKYLGRKGLISGLMGKLPSVNEDERPSAGKELNILKTYIQKELERKKNELLSGEAKKGEKIDVTMPGILPEEGRLHPITKTLNEINDIFVSLGFKIAEGPEIEKEFYNFEALNIPPEHPSRDAFDTFYIKNDVLLRSHTSTVQIRIMEKTQPPIQAIMPGKVYRPDAVDASHSFMFHQVEGLLVDKDVKFSDLKGVLSLFTKRMFGEKTKTRFRPSFFPFTEPSAEVDISCIICRGKGCRVCSHTRWLEILGAGMVNPRVFEAVGYSPNKYTGFAFGMGVERIAMLKYGIDDIRLFFENDVRFLKQF